MTSSNCNILTGGDLLTTTSNNSCSPTPNISTVVNPLHLEASSILETSSSSSSSTTSRISPSKNNGMCDEKTVEYLRDLISEKQSIENYGGKGIILSLLDQEITRIQGGGKPPGRESKFVDIYHEKPIRLTVRVIVPVREHPKFNFVGKLLGPKGNSMKRLQEETLTKMAVLGRGSMRNKQQEEELRKTKDPKYHHLNEDLHVEITAFASPSEAHARIAYALTEVRKYLIPDSNDEIRQKQMREIEIMNRSKDSEEISSDEHGSTSPSSSLIAMRGLFNNNNNNCSTSGRKGTTILPHGAIVALNGNGSDVTTSKVRVYSILDKIRANSLIPNDTQAPAYVETINLLDKNGFTYEDLENVGVSSDLSSVTKGFKERSRCIRMQIAPYPTRHK
ncbi:uncharacterized protein [Lepeophtheirus salmonis]|uniref:uncharacterized protein isoform X2 n=1 Tax=Lepeophtheirus salmonis TaxID=72036 RepID=UPI003AF39CF2